MVPLNTAKLSLEALKLAERALQVGNVGSATDAGVGAQIAFTGVRGGIFNVLINLPQIQDREFKEDMMSTCSQLEKDGELLLDQALNALWSYLETNLS